MEIENVNGKANAGLTLGIIGTALAGLMGIGGGALGLASATNNTSSNYVTKDEMKMIQDLAAKDSEIALLTAESNTESKMIEVYKQAHAEVAALESIVNTNQANQQTWNAQQAVNNAQMASAIATNANSISAINTLLGGLTKTVIPSENVCPEPMAKYNSWTAPTTTTTTTA